MKRGCKEIIEAISESAEMNPKEFIRGLGLEVDEDFGNLLRDLYLFNICLGRLDVSLGKERPLSFELDEEVFV